MFLFIMLPYQGTACIWVDLAPSEFALYRSGLGDICSPSALQLELGDSRNGLNIRAKFQIIIFKIFRLIFAKVWDNDIIIQVYTGIKFVFKFLVFKCFFVCRGALVLYVFYPSCTRADIQVFPQLCIPSVLFSSVFEAIYCSMSHYWQTIPQWTQHN